MNNLETGNKKVFEVNPNVGNLINSLRDIGYTFEVAIADILDNSISASAYNIQILAESTPSHQVSILDDGSGMTEDELIEAMRLATKSPLDDRSEQDLGRFGLGLKTASFSQCKKLTVVSKKDNNLSVMQWDLDYISKENKWLLLRPDLVIFENNELFAQLKEATSGTLVLWQELDRIQKFNLSDELDKLRKHLSLTFHRFLERSGQKKLNILVNNLSLAPFNPFNTQNNATQELDEEKLRLDDGIVTIQPFILPHHSKTTQQEFDQFATDDGYTKSQGFYLYRGNRLLIYGTWWGLHKMSDAHKLVRIRIDIPNNQDSYWGIDIKKSTAKPVANIRGDLQRIISQVVEKGSRPFTGRGRKIKDKTTVRFWNLRAGEKEIQFILDNEHPVYQELIQMLDSDSKKLLDIYLKGIQAYLPLASIQAQLNQSPHLIQQEAIIEEADAAKLADLLNRLKLDEAVIARLKKTEVFKNRKNLLEGGDEQ